jgi:hypothetical protein
MVFKLSPGQASWQDLGVRTPPAAGGGLGGVVPLCPAGEDSPARCMREEISWLTEVTEEALDARACRRSSSSISSAHERSRGVGERERDLARFGEVCTRLGGSRLCCSECGPSSEIFCKDCRRRSSRRAAEVAFQRSRMSEERNTVSSLGGS